MIPQPAVTVWGRPLQTILYTFKNGMPRSMEISEMPCTYSGTGVNSGNVAYGVESNTYAKVKLGCWGNTIDFGLLCTAGCILDTLNGSPVLWIFHYLITTEITKPSELYWRICLLYVPMFWMYVWRLKRTACTRDYLHISEIPSPVPINPRW